MYKNNTHTRKHGYLAPDLDSLYYRQHDAGMRCSLQTVSYYYFILYFFFTVVL